MYQRKIVSVGIVLIMMFFLGWTGFLNADVRIVSYPDSFIIENKIITIKIDRESGSPSSFWNNLTNDNLIKRIPSFVKSPFLLTLLKDKELNEADVDGLRPNIDFKGNDSKKTLFISYDYVKIGEKRIPIKVTYSICLVENSPQSEWRIDIKNNSKEYQVFKVAFPRLFGISLGENYQDDWLIYPQHSGVRYLNPTETLATDEKIIGLEIERTEEGFLLRQTYIGRASMMWMDLYDEKGGLYFASHDKELLNTDVCAFSPGASNPGIGLYFDKYAYIPSGSSWESSPYIIAFHQEAWHKGADIYKTWTDTFFKKPRIPKWIKEDASGIMVGGDWGKKSFASIRDALKLAESFDLNNVEVWSFQPWKPLPVSPFLDPKFGSEEEFREVCDEIIAQGKYVGVLDIWPYYIYSGLEEEPSPGDWREHWRNHACLGADGQRTPFSAGLIRMCPAAPLFQEYIKERVKIVMKKYHIQGFLSDTLGAEWPSYCLDFSHGHQEHGIWAKGLVEMLKQVQEAGCEVNPDFFILTEGCGDSIGQYVQFFQTRGIVGEWQGFRFTFPEMFRYTFPEYVSSEDLVKTPGADKYLFLDRAFVLGMRFRIHDIEDITDDKELSNYIRQVIHLMKETGEFTSYGTFRDTVNLNVSNPEVEAKLFTRDDEEIKGGFVAIRNPKLLKGVRVKVNPVGFTPVKSLFKQELNQEIEKIDFIKEQEIIEFIAPEKRLSAVYLINRAKPHLRVTSPSKGTPGMGVKPDIILTNLENRKIKLDLSLTLPENWKSERIESLWLNPGQTIKKSPSIYVPSQVQLGRAYPITVHAKIEGNIYSENTYVRLDKEISGEILIDYSKGAIVVSLSNNMDRESKGSCYLKTDKDINLPNNWLNFSLTEGESKTLEFPIRSLRVSREGKLKADISYEGKIKEISSYMDYPTLTRMVEGIGFLKFQSELGRWHGRFNHSYFRGQLFGLEHRWGNNELIVQVISEGKIILDISNKESFSVHYHDYFPPWTILSVWKSDNVTLERRVIYHQDHLEIVWRIIPEQPLREVVLLNHMNMDDITEKKSDYVLHAYDWPGFPRFGMLFSRPITEWNKIREHSHSGNCECFAMAQNLGDIGLSGSQTTTYIYWSGIESSKGAEENVDAKLGKASLFKQE